MKRASSLSTAKVASSDIYAGLRASILHGELEGGTPLRQDEIARQYGVSKIPVREALRRLESEGLVEFRPRRGAIVRDIPASEVLELIDVRLALECRALELAVPQMIDSDFGLAAEIQEEYQAETDRERWSELNLRFHHAILEPCGNRYLLSLISDIEQRMGAVSRLRVTQASGLERPLREHDEILEACRAGDVETAVARLRSHIETTRKEFVAFLRRSAVRSINSPTDD